MPFLHPALLWGMLSLAVPILLMLLLTRRKLILNWAAYEWMKNAIVQRKKKIQMDDILKLISKLLLLAAIVLLIARPFIRLKAASGNTLVILDNSPSMGVTFDEGVRLDKAKRMVESFVGSYENPVALYSFDGALESVVAKYTTDRKALADGVKSIELGTTYSGASTLFEEVGKLSILPDTKKIYVVGDFQSHWYGNGPKIVEHMKRLGSGYPMIWQQMDNRADIQNCAVEKLEMTPEGTFAGRETFFITHVLNGSSQATEDRTLTFYVDGKRKSQIVLKLQPNERREVPFAIALGDEGWHNVSAELDSDLFKTDDARYAAVSAPPPIRILGVAPDKGDQPFPFDVYVASAIRCLIAEQKMSYKCVLPIELASANLADFDLVVTVMTPLRPGAPYAQKLKEFVERGGGLISFLPAQEADEASLFGLGCRVIETPGHVKKETLGTGYLSFMSAPDLKPENINFSKSLIFTNAAVTEARLIVEKGTNAVSRKVDKGRVVILGFAPYQGYSDLHFNPNFVQMMLRMLWEARGHRGVCEVSGTFDEWKEPWLNKDNTYTLHDEKNGQWKLTVDGLGAKTRLLIPPDMKYGFYTIKEDGNEKIRIGYNPDTGDSQLEPVTEKELEQPIKEGLTFSGSDTLLGSLSRIDLLWLSAILLIAAIVLEAYAHFFRDKPT